MEIFDADKVCYILYFTINPIKLTVRLISNSMVKLEHRPLF